MNKETPFQDSFEQKQIKGAFSSINNTKRHAVLARTKLKYLVDNESTLLATGDETVSRNIKEAIAELEGLAAELMSAELYLRSVQKAIREK